MKKQKDWIGRVIVVAIFLAIGFSLFFFGSWKIMWNESVSWLDAIVLQSFDNASVNDSFLCGSHVIGIRINEGYYGFIRGDRFIDSPVLQWIMLPLSFVAFGWAIEKLIFGEISFDD